MKKVVIKNTEPTSRNLQSELFKYLEDELFEDALSRLVEEEIVKDRIKQNYPGYKIYSKSWEYADRIEDEYWEVCLIKEE